ncbi:MAG: TIGR02206 family membrane protein [bacterium]
MHQFVLFGLSHWIGLIGTLALAYLGIVIVKKFPAKLVIIKRVTGLILLSMFIFYQIYIIFITKEWSVSGNLPIHITNFILFFLGFNLIFESQLFFDLSFFWGISGGLLSVIFPDIRNDFPDIYYIFHWVSHAPMIFAVVLGFYPSKLKINFTSLLRAVAFGAVYIAIVYPLNLLLNSNYGYLLSSPEEAQGLVNSLAQGNYAVFIGIVFLFSIVLMGAEYLAYKFFTSMIPHFVGPL